MKFGAMLCIAAVSIVPLSCAKAGRVSHWPTQDWRTASPEKVGMDARVLEPLLSVRESLPDITSVLAVRHGRIAFEHYYEGDRESLRAVRGIAKSVISCLVGIAIDQGLIDGVDQKMIDFFPGNEILQSDPLAQQISLRDLLTMSDGIRASGNMMHAYFTDPRQSLPLKSDPGARFEDNYMSAQIVSMILTRASGKSAYELGRQQLFEPLGITSSLWKDFAGMPGVSHGADGLLLSSRDMAKIGYLFLNGGSWEGRQLVPAGWVAESTAAQIQTGEPAEYFRQYGYFWWVHPFGARPAYFALGSGGQAICVVPDLDLVAVVTGNAEDAAGDESKYLEVVEKHIIGAITK